MLATLIAWAVGLVVLGIIGGGFVVGRRRRVATGLFTVPTDDTRLAARTELQRGQLQALHNAQQLGPGGV